VYRTVYRITHLRSKLAKFGNAEDISATVAHDINKLFDKLSPRISNLTTQHVANFLEESALTWTDVAYQLRRVRKDNILSIKADFTQFLQI
jgi:hypothetical protein